MANDDLDQLKKRLAEIDDLQKAAALLHWDQQTYMPRGGAEGRSRQSATLARMAHEKFIEEEVGVLLEDLAAETKGQPYEDDTVSLVRVTRRDYDKARRVPGDFVAELTQIT